ncbi:hypothetical protein E2C01_083248 [Portunus trituberculatus]|uniref:SGNH hydrolase-type esterase domain-containing protein n=1 Tax=Portunus trituberculatus TaxID=210409 RepID=A0A5B7J401_PORTR|nr:hypothetical protein [Portunus trituberculatus]
MFRVAIVGHSQIPVALPGLPDDIEVSLFRVPGARAQNFFTNSVFMSIFESKFDLIILWIGSNDIHSRCRVKEIVADIKAIVEQLEAVCTPRIKICLIEPRRPDPKRSLQTKRFISFGARPFAEGLARDGVHFNRQTREYIQSKLRNAIQDSYLYWPTQLWGHSDKKEEEEQ